ncbi:hypothetical protein [Nannocystis pusilla]|uniref:Uncharacterized protein n=1 Tax=Nannocystis pusilla TaxID=889268 RepID=A0ABS7TRA5_9BACT|nr:hypothetical protein [Nannocystis pusilla]MBZ5710711.1 hypothetical protein [Nannocystis pusilla]
MPDIGDAEKAPWVGACHDLLRQLAEDSDHPAPSLRLAMFLAKMFPQRDAAAHVQRAIDRTNGQTLALQVWLLRNLIPYYMVAGESEEADDRARQLYALTQAHPDVGDMLNETGDGAHVHPLVGAVWECI